MRSCAQARILTWTARALSVAATGAVSWYVAQPIAEHFGTTLTDPMQIGIGGFFALIAFFVSKRALDFTQDCMTVPDALAASATDLKRTCRKKSCGETANSDSGASSSASQTGSDSNDQIDANQLSTTVADHQSMKVSVQTTDGATLVTVTICGVSSSRFKDKQSGLRKKIEGIGGVNWGNPKNLGNGNREMVGRIIDASRRESVIARLQSLAASV